ncbi:16S rRNA (adenine(1518)-N(6)/adenine(1519)-N(6))-dimethyltransferase RsmA [uncultured Sphaerotilus sp.]|uniref:16S rRNA (adenine(1518)-N(6)/adenine(1519)-N(6))- dimethyltransferase RsmA n=1 Tax=uncultured Sphaerotilus sp. TaxID=474984 RepID=UPI0030CA1616
MKHIPRKRFGQHFLTDGAVLSAIVRAIDPRPGEALVEIGPGMGAMTDPIVECCEHLTVVELDRDLAARLRKRPELTVIESDVLKVDFREVARLAQATYGEAHKLRVVGNLPYNISSPILFHLLDFVDVVEDQHFMLQKEVVDRMAASPGKKDFGRLSVMLQWRYDIESLIDVPPECFDPPPRVNSAVVRMTPLRHPPAVDVALLSELVAVAFSQRRKMLRNTLGHWLAERCGDDVPAFDLQRRAEEVPVADYVALVTAVGLRDAAKKTAP